MESAKSEVRRLMVAIDRLDEVYYSAHRQSGIKDSLFVLMYALADGAPRSQKQICEEWHIPRSTINTVVLEQIEAGNIDTVATGHKEKLLSLTPKGWEFMQSKLGALFDAERDATSSVEVGSIADALNLFAAHLEKQLGNQPEAEECA